jgi:hypothetical protein
MWDFVMDKSGAGTGFLWELRFPLPIYIQSAKPNERQSKRHFMSNSLLLPSSTVSYRTRAANVVQKKTWRLYKWTALWILTKFCRTFLSICTYVLKNLLSLGEPLYGIIFSFCFEHWKYAFHYNSANSLSEPIYNRILGIFDYGSTRHFHWLMSDWMFSCDTNSDTF